MPFPAGMDLIDRLRAFNRLYTARMGLLGRSYLGTGRSMSEMRVLHDLAAGGQVTARALAQRLEIDEGYLSRILARLDREGWLKRAENPADRRQKTLSLTASGQAEAASLAARSREDVARRLEALDAEATAQLSDGIAAVTAALSPPEGPATLRPLGPGDIGWITMEHGRLYDRDEGYGAEFEALVARILSDFTNDHDPACERGWIAEAGGRRLGCIFCVREDETTARLRLFLLLPEARGLGLGRQLLTACTDYARACGYTRMVLWTHESHEAACRLYERTGWRQTSRRANRAFGQDVVDLEYEIDL